MDPHPDAYSPGKGKLHAVCVPAPYQGHINPMLDLAKLLFHKGFHITFVITQSTHKSVLESRDPRSLDGLPDFRFEAIPDASPSSDTAEPPPVTAQRLLSPFRELVAKLNCSATSDVPPPSCIVSDGIMIFTLTVAQELAIPVTLFSTCSAASFMLFPQLTKLRDKGFIPLKDESYLKNGYLDTVIDWIPGIKDIRLRDLPSFIRTTDQNCPWFQFCLEVAEKGFEASTVVLHSFNALEHDVLEALSSMFHRVHAIGPLHLLLKKIQDDPLKSVGYNLWKEDMECLQWLDDRPQDSVVYVNFGSLAVLTPEQMLEFAWGLANSKHPFLWVIRDGLVMGDGAVLPPELLEDTKDRGMVTSWCPQEEVLKHEAVGGFLTHCGWNSTIESIAAGVPMICRPFFADQQTNCRYICREWGIGVELGDDVRRDEVERLVRELMEGGDKGKEMKSNVMDWKRKAEEAAAEDGSSSLALDKLVHELLLKHSELLFPQDGGVPAARVSEMVG